LPLLVVLRVHPTREPPHFLGVNLGCGVGSRLGNRSGSWGRLGLSRDVVVGVKCVTLLHQLRVGLAGEMIVGVRLVPLLGLRGLF